MELQFKQSVCPCLETAVRDVRNMELTQEIRLPSGMPDIGHILCAWGQTVLRGKEWRSDSLSFSGGMMVWVLYAPEDGTQERCIEDWIPFQMNWDLPENTPEGVIRIQCITRFVDARSVSARKIMVRAGTAAQAEAFVPMEASVWEPEETPESVELLRSRWPIRMPKEAGEKSFLLDEDLELPGSAPLPEKIICFRMEPKVTEKKVLGNKLVFRGNGNLHVLYRSTEGQLHGWEFELPFSQFAELNGDYGPDGQGDLILSPTSLELELGDNGRMRFKGGIVSQYRITDKQMITTTEDAYSPGRELELHREELGLPAVLENRRENIYGEQTIPGDANVIADVRFLPDFPRQRQVENGMELELPGQFQVLYYGADGILRAANARWEGRHRVKADENTRLQIAPGAAEMPRAVSGEGQITVSTEVPLDMTAVTRQAIPMITGLELGQARQKDPDRPSLILRRVGEERLWDIAKSSGSTMDAIRHINGLQEEPAPGRMLLIPVP